MYILGISAYYHDSAAALLCNGEIVAAAQEERFTRIKHDPSFPSHAIQFVMNEGGIEWPDLGAIAFYDKPLLKFERLLESYYAHAPKGIGSFIAAMPVWIKEKLFLRDTLKKEFSQLGFPKKAQNKVQWFFPEHHLSHAASAFYPSPFEEAAFLTVDGVGEFTTTSFGIGKGKDITLLKEIHFPHSLGPLYSAFTYFCGFKVNSGEYKLMGLAPFGKPIYAGLIREKLIDLKKDGSFQLNMDYFPYEYRLRMINRKFEELFDGPPRKSESPISQREIDIAASIQEVTEDAVLNLGRAIYQETGQKNLVLAGGVALNCVANGKLWKEGIFEKIWIQPAAGDAGGALGAAQAAHHLYFGHERRPQSPDGMQGALLGNQVSQAEIERLRVKYGAKYQTFQNYETLAAETARLLEGGNVVGWVQGRMEFGPRALGSRSILGDARNAEMQRTMNLKIKFRESFRPFAPIVLREHVQDYFDYTDESPYMLMVAPILEKWRLNGQMDLKGKGLSVINEARSTIPAITHVDYSARLQTVDQQRHPHLHTLLTAFHQRTGCPILVNTSFNVRGEPIVSSAEDAYRCFMRTRMDYLVINNTLFEKSTQPAWEEMDRWQNTFELD